MDFSIGLDVVLFIMLGHYYKLNMFLGLFGSSNLEAAVCDMMIESVNDILLICVDRMFKAKTEEEKVKLAMTVIDRACRL